MVFTLLRGDIGALPPDRALGTPHPVAPVFEAGAILSIGVSLFQVTLVSQTLPGLVVLRSAGFEPGPRPLLAGSGLAWLIAALPRARYPRLSCDRLGSHALRTGSAFWGLALGFATLAAETWLKRR